jgi:hypothetical protein
MIYTAPFHFATDRGRLWSVYLNRNSGFQFTTERNLEFRYSESPMICMVFLHDLRATILL